MMQRFRTIGELTRLYGLTARTLRYYEDEGLIASSRDAMNRRTYDLATCERLEMIIPLRNAGVPLSDISVFLKLGDNADDPAMHIAFALKKLQQRLETVRLENSAICDAIQLFESNGGGRQMAAPPMKAQHRAGARL